VQAVILLDSNPATVLAGEGLNLHPVNSSENIFLSVLRIQERNLAFVTLEIEIVDHYKTFQLVKKKTL
jgi:hypothetical protein